MTNSQFNAILEIMNKLDIDISSTTVKVAVLDEKNQILFNDYERHMTNIQPFLLNLLTKISNKLGDIDMNISITGFGGSSLSNVLDAYFCQEEFAVSKALKTYNPSVNIAIEFGGEDAKIIYFDRDIDQRMNGICAGVTGSFLDQMEHYLKQMQLVLMNMQKIIK